MSRGTQAMRECVRPTALARRYQASAFVETVSIVVRPGIGTQHAVGKFAR